jgi:hypothetical protein
MCHTEIMLLELLTITSNVRAGRQMGLDVSVLGATLSSTLCMHCRAHTPCIHVLPGSCHPCSNGSFADYETLNVYSVEQSWNIVFFTNRAFNFRRAAGSHHDMKWKLTPLMHAASTVSQKRRSKLGWCSHSLASARQEHFGTMFDFAPAGQNDCWHPTQGLELVVGEMSPPVVKLLGTLFAPLALGLIISHWTASLAAEADCRRRLALLMSILPSIRHRHWLWSVWHSPVGQPMVICVGHDIKVRQLLQPTRCPFFPESTQPFESSLWILADPCTKATPLLLPARWANRSLAAEDFLAARPMRHIVAHRCMHVAASRRG